MEAFDVFSSFDVTMNGGSVNISFSFQFLLLLSTFDDMTHGCMAVDALDGVEEIEGLEQGTSV